MKRGRHNPQSTSVCLWSRERSRLEADVIICTSHDRLRGGDTITEIVKIFFVLVMSMRKKSQPASTMAALCGSGDGSCNFHRPEQAALCGACVCLCLFLLLNIVCLSIYAKLGLVVGMTKQMSDGKELAILNPSKIMSTSFRSVGIKSQICSDDRGIEPRTLRTSSRVYNH